MDDAKISSAEPVGTRRQPLVRGWRLVAMAVVLAFAALVALRTFVIDVYFIPSESMQPLVNPGDRILVQPMDAQQLQRGDVIVFDGAGSFAPYVSGSPWLKNPLKTAGQWAGLVGTESVYVKRVVGVGGDTVECCDAEGRLLVNGEPLNEAYVYPGDQPSTIDFSVQVPAGRMWVMGDHRSASVDSRSLLGVPGGGMISTDKIIGKPTRIFWPLERAQTLE
ncbi:signal peptidase I [Rothia sp. ZJ1223]|uniref:signal peptidase I n=1 Tax=Rothia sp. ZJ1223 TaxID=2811098 RepID=UPI00195F0CEF|nr:signal peptidase I [Rothia sp. ZJ1223]MBM7050907.1 signal peptidase I [Rothia sp. ZJ1223]